MTAGRSHSCVMVRVVFCSLLPATRRVTGRRTARSRRTPASATRAVSAVIPSASARRVAAVRTRPARTPSRRARMRTAVAVPRRTSSDATDRALVSDRRRVTDRARDRRRALPTDRDRDPDRRSKVEQRPERTNTTSTTRDEGDAGIITQVTRDVLHATDRPSAHATPVGCTPHRHTTRFEFVRFP